MADEINSDISNEFISPSNEDKSQFQPKTFSQEENDNHEHIQPIQNGNIHEDSSNIQLLQPTENHSTNTQFIQQITTQNHSTETQFIEEITPENLKPTENDSKETQFIEETTSNNLEATSPSHIQPVNIYDQQEDSSEIDQKSFEQSNTFNNNDQSNILNNPDDNDTSNIDTNFQTQTNLHDKPDQFKAQRELDENEIPPAETLVDERAINDETNITDDRPLTELETPYEHHHENENDSVEFPLNETPINNETNLIDNYPLTEIENSDENENENESLSPSLPDLVTETFEENHVDFNDESIESERPLIEENLVKNEFNLIEEDFPPLPPSSIAIEQTIFKEENFPRLTSRSIAVEQIDNKELKFEDILGNKTLLKQTIVEGIFDSRPTRSTMVRISYRLSLVDNITSNVRVIENVSNENFFVSERDLIPAIDICVLLMNRGERALIDSDIRHCYGEIGCEEKEIPPISSLNSYRMKIDLELHDWISPPDVQFLSIEERLYWGDKKRQIGNFYYRRQDYKTSLLCYHGALRFLSTDDNPILISFDESQRSILNDRYIQVQNNVAQVNLFLNKYQACLNAVENVLKYDSKNVKALFRQGKALFELGKYEQAIQPLKLFTQIQKENSNLGIDNDKANEMISISEKKLANYQKSEKEIYRRMFQPTTTNSTLNQQHQTKNINQIDNGNKNWWPYIALGSAALATIGLVTFIKYRKVS